MGRPQLPILAVSTGVSGYRDRSMGMKRTRLRKVSKAQIIKNRTWSQIKWVRIEAIIEAKGYLACERCEKRMTAPHAHHNVSRARGGENSFENMRLVCFDCHRQLTDYPTDIPGLL